MDDYNYDDLKEEDTGTQLEEDLNKILNEKGLRYPSKIRLRNLINYKNMPDAQFEEAYAKMVMGVRYDREWEKRILLKMREFEKDYDLSDLKINDINNLRSLAAANIRLTDMDSVMGQLLSGGVNLSNITLIEKVGKQQNDLRDGIAKLEDMLKISRKIRKSDEENSVPAFIEDLKKKAKLFYEQKMMYIICPKCNTLLATVWFLYPEYRNNFVMYCAGTLPNGESCSFELKVASKTLLANKMSNKPEVLPEELR